MQRRRPSRATVITQIFSKNHLHRTLSWQAALAVKKLPTSAGDARDVGLIPGSGRSPGEGMAAHSSVPAWRLPWTEEPGGLKSMGSQESDTTEQHTL